MNERQRRAMPKPTGMEEIGQDACSYRQFKQRMFGEKPSMECDVKVTIGVRATETTEQLCRLKQ